MSHYYNLKGETRYTVPYADKNRKGRRPTTLRDAKKNGWVPSVTTIMQCAAKPGLDIWKQNQLLEAAVDLRHSPFVSDSEQYKRAIKQQAAKMGEDASKRGTELHDSLEQYYIDESLDDNEGFTVPAIQLLTAELGELPWVPEASFAHPDGYGGKVDLSATADTGESYIVDFKTKMTPDLKKMTAYDEHVMQLVAYADGLGMKNPRLFNLFISTESTGIVKLVEHTPEQIERAREMFNCLLKYWQLSNNYNITNKE